jgi:hypothetical protein
MNSKIFEEVDGAHEPSAATLTVDDRSSDLIWYISYGSNLDRERFLIYILGGTPNGSKAIQPGCPDRTLPIKDQIFEIPNSLYFAGHSFAYDGGVAFITQDTNQEPTKARGYLITYNQFRHVLAQENNLTESIALPELTTIRESGHVISEGSDTAYYQYTRVIYCGEQEGYPMLSLTSAQQHEAIVKPSPLYIRTISAGLKEAHKLNPTNIADYLIGIPGIKENYSHSALVEILDNM